MDNSKSLASSSLFERLLRMLRRRSDTAASLLHTLCSLTVERQVPLYVVGGLVRDLLLDAGDSASRGLDLDFAIDGDPKDLLPALEQFGVGSPTTHDRFGTASVVLSDGVNVDVARTRSERYSVPGALPIVAPTSIDVDLGRRDFTINAAAIALTGDREGQLIDPYDAAGDIERRVIRTLHEHSFRDDPTRLVRAARYAARIEGTIDRRTLADARRDRRHLTTLTAGRFGDAWRLLLEEADAPSALGIARRLKIPQSREPRWTVPPAVVAATDGAETFWASMELVGREPNISDWLPKSVGLNRVERSALEAGAELRVARRSIGSMRRRSSVARALKRYPDSALRAAARVWGGPSGSAIGEFLALRESVRSPISAHRLIELGIEPGPQLGRWLAVVEDAVWDGELDPADASAITRMEQQIRLSR